MAFDLVAAVIDQVIGHVLCPPHAARKVSIGGVHRAAKVSRDLYRHLRRAGLAAVRQQTVLVEHFAPLPAEALAFYGPACAQIAEQAGRLGLDGQWERFASPDAPGNPLRHPDGYVSEGAVLAIGTVGS